MDGFFLEKKSTIIDQINSKGFLYYFLRNIAKISNGNIANLKNLWLDITQTPYKKKWIIKDNHLCFQMNDELYYNLCVLTFIGNQEEDLDFFKCFSEKYCIPFIYKNISFFMNISKDEYKNSWIIDKNKCILYFRFKNVCGEGAMKKTYYGWNVSHNVPIVVYQINISSNQIEQKRYVNEKRIGEIKKSKYLLHIHYSYTQREFNKVYMISDYYPYSVKNLIDKQYKWSIQELKLFSKQILLGLKDLHDLNIIHRDIKPCNILYDKINQCYKIIDFGIATKYNIHSNSIETMNQFKSNDELSLVGTIGYIAPEMYKSLYNLNQKIKYNYSVDLYSFGITLL